MDVSRKGLCVKDIWIVGRSHSKAVEGLSGMPDCSNKLNINHSHKLIDSTSLSEELRKSGTNYESQKQRI